MLTLGHVDFLIWFASDIDIVGWAVPTGKLNKAWQGSLFFFNQVSTEFRGKSRVR